MRDLQHFLFLRFEHRGQVKSVKWPLEVTSPLHAAVLGLFLYEMLLCDLATPQHPSSLVPSPLGINRKAFIPVENFSFNLSFLCSSAGAKSYPLRESSCRGACVSLWWMIYWCLSGLNRSKAVAWQAINQASNQGWQSQSGTLKIHFSFSLFFFLACFLFFLSFFTGINTSNTLACKNEIRRALFGELGCWQPSGRSALKRWNWSAAERIHFSRGRIGIEAWLPKWINTVASQTRLIYCLDVGKLCIMTFCFAQQWMHIAYWL